MTFFHDRRTGHTEEYMPITQLMDTHSGDYTHRTMGQVFNHEYAVIHLALKPDGKL